MSEPRIAVPSAQARRFQLAIIGRLGLDAREVTEVQVAVLDDEQARVDVVAFLPADTVTDLFNAAAAPVDEVVDAVPAAAPLAERVVAAYRRATVTAERANGDRIAALKGGATRAELDAWNKAYPHTDVRAAQLAAVEEVLADE
jgi:hypothetical protein